MKKTALFLTFLAAVAFAPAARAQGWSQPPHYDVVAGCLYGVKKDLADEYGDLERERCIRHEETYYNTLSLLWPQLSEAEKQGCLAHWWRAQVGDYERLQRCAYHRLRAVQERAWYRFY